MKKYLFILIILSVNIIGFSQEKLFEGLPLIKNYSPKEYNAEGQTWSVAQKDNGITYFGNNSGILEFDGINSG